MSAPGGGFGVHPDALRAAARHLRLDAESLDAGGSRASVAAQQAVHTGGALGRSASEFASQIDKAIGAMRRSIDESADALDAASTDYTATDQATVRGLVLPGFDGSGGAGAASPGPR